MKTASIAHEFPQQLYSQWLKAKCLYRCEWGKKYVLHSCNEIVLINKKKQTTDAYNMYDLKLIYLNENSQTQNNTHCKNPFN